MYNILFTSKSKKDLFKLAKTDQKRVLEKITLLSVPFPHNLDIKKLQNVSGFYRLRVGTVRILFEVVQIERDIWIRKIGYRGSIYQ